MAVCLKSGNAALKPRENRSVWNALHHFVCFFGKRFAPFRGLGRESVPKKAGSMKAF